MVDRAKDGEKRYRVLSPDRWVTKEGLLEAAKSQGDRLEGLKKLRGRNRLGRPKRWPSAAEFRRARLSETPPAETLKQLRDRVPFASQRVLDLKLKAAS